MKKLLGFFLCVMLLGIGMSGIGKTAIIEDESGKGHIYKDLSIEKTILEYLKDCDSGDEILLMTWTLVGFEKTLAGEALLKAAERGAKIKMIVSNRAPARQIER